MRGWLMKARISEVFDSLQGEGLYLGERQIFVRFFGCNLKCRFCDTVSEKFAECRVADLMKKIKRCRGDYHSISFTGGEPLQQKDFLKEALRATRQEGFKNYLETNGTLPEALEEVISHLDIVAMDLKLPSSTGIEQVWDEHFHFLEIASQKEVFLKAVICRSTKKDDLRESVRLIKEANRSAVLVLQPNSYESHPELHRKLEDFQDICRKEGVVSCIIAQMQKMIGIK